MAVGVSVCLLAACVGDALVEPGPAAPTVGSVTVVTNPHNVLSGVVTFGVTEADSARVVYQAQGGQAAATPYHVVDDGSATIATLGLVAGTQYSHIVEAVGPGGSSASDPVSFTTGALPDPLPTVQFQIVGTATPGYTLIGLRVGGFVVAIDESGRIRWYQQLDGYAGTLVTQQPSFPLQTLACGVRCAEGRRKWWTK